MPRLLKSSLITVAMAGLFALPVHTGFTRSAAKGTSVAKDFAGALQTHTVKKTPPKSPDYDTHTIKKVIERKQKPHRPPVPKRQPRVPLLSIQWWVMVQGPDKAEEWTDPNRMFNKDDRIRFGFKVNQPGFLYIIDEALAQDGRVIEPPHILFPDSQANRGQNALSKNVANKEYFVPAYCKGIPDPDDCWLILEGQAGKDVITVLFSREVIIGLADQIARDGNTFIKELMADTVKNLEKKPVNPVARIKKTGDSQPDSGSGNFYITRVTNGNVKDNEEIIFTFNINHRD